ncbi:hypothetical protein [Mesorhizobium sp.]|uniref:hypothetical protein n=1 Tax=Mesorhizobium sp. TaxID=1871066 RepID=UPI00257C2A69|nr:hypothetical protein [Mesorhizobium sp.]
MTHTAKNGDFCRNISIALMPALPWKIRSQLIWPTAHAQENFAHDGNVVPVLGVDGHFLGVYIAITT